ncbi:GNAT family N-acetyltransferase [Streptomyces sp. NBC_01775]|uniref:GNAT family N-acetyltransferase n=1 Tax=Streptomyces sp. NBC_01775 TaxID=2975939 RepID=UPI002DD7F6C0|nr:GNAT family protein [Streptomyces sp. NBC_01775]WSB79596.1 GNAT family N-acetyltransferase [Streptomyces sp. NBC_01775]
MTETRFKELGRTAMEALAAGELDAGSRAVGLDLPDLFVSERARWLWRYRLTQMAADPEGAAWCVRQVLVGVDVGVDAGVDVGVEDSGGQGTREAVVGHAGFHGPPDKAGMVEIGYVTVPAYRRRGYARAALTELLRRAAADPSVSVVRATVAPDNVASLATLAPFGFTHVGEQWDEEDGRELIYERSARAE